LEDDELRIAFNGLDTGRVCSAYSNEIPTLGIAPAVSDGAPHIAKLADMGCRIEWLSGKYSRFIDHCMATPCVDKLALHDSWRKPR
jgi:hypothetical protein